jgi:hypothetical protein
MNWETAASRVVHGYPDRTRAGAGTLRRVVGAGAVGESIEDAAADCSELATAIERRGTDSDYCGYFHGGYRKMLSQRFLALVWLTPVVKIRSNHYETPRYQRS